MEEYLENLRWRYATKKFDVTRRLSTEQVHFLKETARLSPSSLGIQPWKFYFVSDSKIREQLRPISDNQSQVIDASQLIIISSRIGLNEMDVDEYIQSIATIRNITIESLAQRRERLISFINSKTSNELDAWCAQQSYIALGFILSACAENKIDACPMEGFDAIKVSEFLGIKADGFMARAYCAVGFRSSEDTYASAKKVRFPIEKIIKNI